MSCFILFLLLVFGHSVYSEGECNDTQLSCSGMGGAPYQPGRSIKLAFLTTCAPEDGTKYFLGLRIPGALALAVEKVNSEHILPKNYTISYEVFDTKSSVLNNVYRVCNGSLHNVHAFVGPEQTCNVEAIVGAAFNKPVFSYACGEVLPKNHGTFIRINPTEEVVLKRLLQMLQNQTWTYFQLLYTKEMTSKIMFLEKEAAKMGLKFREPVEVETDLTSLVDTFAETGKLTRVYVVLSHGAILSKFLIAMALNGYLQYQPPQYLLIYLDQKGETYQMNNWDHYVWGRLERRINHLKGSLLQQYNQSLIILRGSYAENVEQFHCQVLDKNMEPPFCLENKSTLGTRSLPYLTASYLHDAVIEYAKAVARLYKEEVKDRPDITVDEVASNGTGIATMLRNYSYRSILDHVMVLDGNVESQGNYVAYLFSVKSHVNFSRSAKISSLNCSSVDFSSKVDLPRTQRSTDGMAQTEYLEEEMEIGLKRIFTFENSTKLLIEFHLNSIPECGFDGKDPSCETGSHNITGIYIALAVFVLFWPIIILLHKIWDAERKITGLQWRITADEIETGANRHKGSTKSLVPMGPQGKHYFSPIGTYMNTNVCLKQVNKEKKFSRELKKEICTIRELNHRCLCSFYGVCIGGPSTQLVSEYKERGSFRDVLQNKDFQFDETFLGCLLLDLIKGMTFLHDNFQAHGRLTSSNCVITSRWQLQITDFGLDELRDLCLPGKENRVDSSHRSIINTLYKSPEILRLTNPKPTKEGDVYSFGILLHEAVGRGGPFTLGYEKPDMSCLERFTLERNVAEVLEKVKKGPEGDGYIHRPSIEQIVIETLGQMQNLHNLMKKCWSEEPSNRATFKSIRASFPKLIKLQKTDNLMDHLMSMMEKHSKNLEQMIESRTNELQDEKKRTEQLLYSMLPKPVAICLRKGIPVEPQKYDSVTIYFSDIVGFTALSCESTPLEIVTFLDDLYRMFDDIISGYDVYKVETIGDAYMVVSGLPNKNDKHAGEIASMALELLAKASSFRIHHRATQRLNLRIGLHTGPVMAGVVGLAMPRYCLFGDTVNTASRMESNGVPNKIHISSSCYEALQTMGGYITEMRGEVDMKGKGKQITYWLLKATGKAIRRSSSAKRKQSMAPYNKRPVESDFRLSSGSQRRSYGDRRYPLVEETTPVPSKKLGYHLSMPHSRKLALNSRTNSLYFVPAADAEKQSLLTSPSLDVIPSPSIRPTKGTTSHCNGGNYAMGLLPPQQSFHQRKSQPLPASPLIVESDL